MGKTMRDTLADPVLRDVMRRTGCHWSSAEEIAGNERSAVQTANRRWLADLPERRAAALAAYTAALAEGGKNAEKRGVRRAREIWSSFVAPR